MDTKTTVSLFGFAAILFMFMDRPGWSILCILGIIFDIFLQAQP